MQQNEIKNGACKMVAILSRPLCVNKHRINWFHLIIHEQIRIDFDVYKHHKLH